MAKSLIIEPTQSLSDCECLHESGDKMVQIQKNLPISALERHICDLIQKPYTSDDVARAVRDALNAVKEQ